jgi:hypothetical protein
VHIGSILNCRAYKNLLKNNLAQDALYRMAYFFLKYFRNLEKFRKNLHSKIPPKSPCTNFQSLGIFNNSIFILKRNSLQFRPSRPNQPTGLFGLFGPSGPTQPSSSSSRTSATVPVSRRHASTAMATLPLGASPHPLLHYSLVVNPPPLQVTL